MEGMARRTGSADLPLHHGSVPAWLSARMARLARVIVEAIVHHYGRDELLRRLAHPFWFQSFGAVMGMDWHSSGITSASVWALKRAIDPLQAELGLHVCGGRGRHSRKTPAELVAVGEQTGLDGERLASVSRLVAKVDSAAVQDGFDLYLHTFVVSDDGAWTVIQQGMNPSARLARRYHWLSFGLDSFVDDPHAAIDGPVAAEEIVNLADRRALASRNAQLALVGSGPDTVINALRSAAPHEHEERAEPTEPATQNQPAKQKQLGLPLTPRPVTAAPPRLILPSHHDVRWSDVSLRRLHGALAAAATRGPRDFPDLLLTPGVGARTVFALALVAEVVHGAPYRFADPARFAFAHGGKDGHPFPVPLKVYDETLRVLRHAVDQANLGQDDRLAALARLDDESRRLEALVTRGPSFDEIVARERELSPALDGRTVQHTPSLPTGTPRERRQLHFYERR
jgi:hypothetical protein